MGYRDATAARRAELEELTAHAEELRERMTEALIDQLSWRDRRGMNEAMARARRERSGQNLEVAIEAVEALVSTLEAVTASAPKLARRFNRHPRRFPPEARPSHAYSFPDIYHEATMRFRDVVHGAIEHVDPEARLYDRRHNYQRRMERPYLVDACFHHRNAPLRLALSARGFDIARHVTSYWALWVLLRPSAPDIAVYPQRLDDRLLKLIRLRRDAEVGQVEFDRAFIVDAGREAAQRTLHSEVTDGLMALREYEPSLTIKAQCARLQWRVEHDTRGLTLGVALDTMAALRRRLKPALLLRPL